MASIGKDPNGHRRILFVAPDGKRKTIRLGKCELKAAQGFKVKLEMLIGGRISGNVSDEVSNWLRDMDDALHAKIAAVGLVAERSNQHIGPWLTKYLDTRKAELKPGSLRKLAQTKAKLLAFFSASTALRAITTDMAADWRSSLVDQGLSEAAVRTHSGNAKTMFAEAVVRKLIAENPFENLRSGPTASAEDRYVTPAETEAIIAALPDAEWKLLFGLARYAGLRIPSESQLLTWADVDFERGRLNVKSPKTERHKGHERRTVPITAKLMKLLQDRFDVAPEGESRLVTMRGSGYVRGTIAAAIKRGGVEPWKKLFQACRSSCEKEWAMVFPQYAVSKWLGHSITVSGRHYANDVPEELMSKASVPAGAKAAQNAAQQPSEIACNGPQMQKPSEDGIRISPQPVATSRKCLQVNDLEAEGIEPSSNPSNSPRKQAFSEMRGTDSGTPPDDSDLAELLNAWPNLSAAKRKIIFGIVRGR